jgi:hypothetical protein
VECRGETLEKLQEILELMQVTDGPRVESSDLVNVILPTLYIPFERKGQQHRRTRHEARRHPLRPR